MLNHRFGSAILGIEANLRFGIPCSSLGKLLCEEVGALIGWKKWAISGESEARFENG
jgi:hypothetical protein